MRLLEGRVALVTGGGAGIGRGIARAFAQNGARVVVAEMNAEDGELVVADIRREIGDAAIFVRTDVSDPAACTNAIECAVAHFGGLDILVNNANSLSPNLPFEEKSDAMLARTMGIGLWGSWWMMRAALPYFKARGGGRIINFYSIDADAGAWLHVDYNATKAAIQAITRSGAMEWARFNILVNAISPAAAGTNFERRCAEVSGYREAASALNPLGRIGDPETDIAPVAVFLASDMSQYITGETISVDGGQHLPRYESKPRDFTSP